MCEGEIFTLSHTRSEFTHGTQGLPHLSQPRTKEQSSTEHWSSIQSQASRKYTYHTKSHNQGLLTTILTPPWYFTKAVIPDTSHGHSAYLEPA